MRTVLAMQVADSYFSSGEALRAHPNSSDHAFLKRNRWADCSISRVIGSYNQLIKQHAKLATQLIPAGSLLATVLETRAENVTLGNNNGSISVTAQVEYDWNSVILVTPRMRYEVSDYGKFTFSLSRSPNDTSPPIELRFLLEHLDGLSFKAYSHMPNTGAMAEALIQRNESKEDPDGWPDDSNMEYESLISDGFMHEVSRITYDSTAQILLLVINENTEVNISRCQ